ncbi:Zn-dependent hydrolase [Pseudogracilibacillus auburnensis]|uniref:Zn-dependent hydrolase n=1 Tax=Pseudogracilibacillus auburnensis TaxID=1494959 RepID=UPI0027DA6AD1|nr:Zn-dependent hydrolase [Pseudogracilibacillus auburnensis]
MIEYEWKQINKRRLFDDLDKYASYGKDERGGITRPSFSKADIEVRKMFIQELEDLGLEVKVDGIANIWGTLKGNGKKSGAIVIGSHLDTVPNGGKYDGALGVLIAKEVICCLKERNLTLDHDIEIVSFTAEESNDFGLSTLGSRTFVGKLTEEDLFDVADSSGQLLRDALKVVGGDLESIKEMEQMRKDKKVFIEVHIEQGQRLENKNISVAIVNNLVGMYRCHVSVIGESNHSGTTMMEDRNDALTAASKMISVVETICKSDETDLVGTVGKLDVHPNAVNIIPGKVDFFFEIRGESQSRMEEVIQGIEREWKSILKDRDVIITKNVILEQVPIQLDNEIVAVLEDTAKQIDEPYLKLPSMAIHDAAHMAASSKSAMIFVKSVGGKSHCPEEYSEPKDIDAAANLLLQGVLEIDRRFD